MSAQVPRQSRRDSDFFVKPPPNTYRVEMGKDGWYYLKRDGDDLVVCRRGMQSQCRTRAAELGLPLREDGGHE